MANLQRCISQPCYTLIKTEVRMSLNTYKITTKFTILCFTLLSISVGINTVQSFGLWVGMKLGFELRGGQSLKQFFFFNENKN